MLTKIQYALDRCLESYDETKWDQLGKDLKFFKEIIHSRHQFSLISDIVSDLHNMRPNNEVWSLGSFEILVDNGSIVLDAILAELSEKRKLQIMKRKRKICKPVMEGEFE